MPIERHLLTLYTRTPLHVGSGASVDVVDLPITRERITGYPVIPGSSLKGVLLQRGRELWPSEGEGNPTADPPSGATLHPNNQMLFGAVREERVGEERRQVSNAGCLQLMEGKILAFPVRSVAGSFAWITCPAVLHRFQRDAGRTFNFPAPAKDRAAVIAAAEVQIPGKALVVLEEYAIATLPGEAAAARHTATALKALCTDPLWSRSLETRLVVVHDDNFQHFVLTCTEVVPRIATNPATRTTENLFNQENVPCETLFYSVIAVLPPRQNQAASPPNPSARLGELLPAENPPLLQIGGDETTGHGICTIHREVLS